MVLRQGVRLRVPKEPQVNKEQKNKRLKAFIGSGIALLAFTYFGKELDPAMVEMLSDRLVMLYVAYVTGQSGTDLARYIKGKL